MKSGIFIAQKIWGFTRDPDNVFSVTETCCLNVSQFYLFNCHDFPWRILGGAVTWMGGRGHEGNGWYIFKMKRFFLPCSTFPIAGTGILSHFKHLEWFFSPLATFGSTWARNLVISLRENNAEMILQGASFSKHSYTWPQPRRNGHRSVSCACRQKSRQKNPGFIPCISS